MLFFFLIRKRKRGNLIRRGTSKAERIGDVTRGRSRRIIREIHGPSSAGPQHSFALLHLLLSSLFDQHYCMCIFFLLKFVKFRYRGRRARAWAGSGLLLLGLVLGLPSHILDTGLENGDPGPSMDGYHLLFFHLNLNKDWVFNILL